MRLVEAPCLGLGVHLLHEGLLSPRIEAPEQVSEVVSRVNEEPIEQVTLGQHLPHFNTDVRLVHREFRSPLRYIACGDHDARTQCRQIERVVVQHHHCRHDLGDAADGDRHLSG